VDLLENEIADISIFTKNARVGHPYWMSLVNNPLSQDALSRDIPVLKGKGRNVLEKIRSRKMNGG